MVKRAEQMHFLKSENPLIWISEDQTIIKVMISAVLKGKPRRVKIPFGKAVKQTDSEGKENLNQLPEQLRSRHDTD